MPLIGSPTFFDKITDSKIKNISKPLLPTLKKEQDPFDYFKNLPKSSNILKSKAQ
jgi:hypothetical protein